MNRKKILIIVSSLTILVAVGGASFYLLNRNDNKNKIDEKSQQTQMATTKQACEILPINNVKELLGGEVKQVNNQGITKPTSNGNNNAPAPVPEAEASKNSANQNPDRTFSLDQQTSNEAPRISTCVYTKEDQSSPVDGTILITLRASNPETSKKDFDAMHTDKAQSISGYGQDAYWKISKDFSNKESGSLIVLKSANLIIISGSKDDLETAKKIAKIAVDNL